jgi:sugar lactone lactonase YvrE
VIAALSTTLVTGMASPSFLMTLAGPSVAPMYPSGLVWDANLNRLIVADTGYNRISVFQAPNWQTPTLQFGALGTNPGQFNTPRQVAVDASSNIYVSDAGNSRLESFTSTGTYRWTTPSGGKLPGSLNVAIGVTYDFANHVVLVADTGHSVVKAFDPSNGNYLWGSPPGMLASPRDAIRGPDGRIWVADYNHEVVKAFDVSADGKTWNTTPAIILGDGAPNGHLLGELNAPYNVQFSLNGRTAYVADTGNERIARWDISGSSPVALSPAFGARCPKICPPPPGNAGYFNALRRVAVDTSGNIWAADFWGSGVHEFSSAGTTMVEIDGNPAPAPGFAEAFGIAVGSDGTTYGVDLLNQRLERFNAAGTYLNSVGFRGTAPGRFSWPESVAVAPDLTVWVADTRNNRLQHFSADLSTVLAVVGSRGSALGQFYHPEGLTVDAGGIVWVADTNNNRIESYNPGNQQFAAFGTRGTANGQLINPQGVAVSATDVYVADTGNNRIEKLTLTGTWEAGFSTGLVGPQGVALAPDGSAWVADTMNNRVVHLSSLLTDLGDGFGSSGTGNMQFTQPHSLAVHGSVLFVADTFNNRVQEFNI